MSKVPVPARRRPGRPAKAGNAVKPVRGICEGLEVMRHIAGIPNGATYADIRRALQLTPVYCTGLLRTLEQQDLLFFDQASRRWKLTGGMLGIARQVEQRDEVVRARALLSDIAAEENATVTLWRRLPSGKLILVMEFEPPSAFVLRIGAGNQRPILVGAAGRLMAAHGAVPREDLSQRFREVNLLRPMPLELFLEEAHEAGRRGWAVDDGYIVDGTVSLSVPGLRDTGEPIFALSATYFRPSFSFDRAELVAHKLLEPARLLASV